MKYILLIIVFLLLAGSVVAAPVDPNAPDGVAARFFSDNALYALDTMGQTWYHSARSSAWSLWSNNLPVPLIEISDWHPQFIVTTDGIIWRAPTLLPPPSENIWYVVDPVPTETVSTQPISGGSLKSMFK